MRVWRAPGRVNLIGEHVDYLGGTVVPFACDREILLATRPLDDEIVVTSLDEPGDVRLPADGSGATPEGWGRFVWGVARALRDAGKPPRGFRGVLSSTIPAGAGLSSSAALEAALALAMLGGERPAAEVLQRAEHLAVGVPCGVMDQVAVLHGRAGHALAIDCGSVTWRPVPLPELGVVVVDTGTRRRLDDGRYAARRREAEDGDPRRRRHVDGENERVAGFLAAMEAGDVATMGRLVSESHASLRDDFEVSSPELDRAVATALAQVGCLGARMVGAGFAGCVLALVRPEAVDGLVGSIPRELPGADAFVVQAVDGAGELER